MPRLLFEKKGTAVWISHLDLMRLFQRAFKRAQLPLTHTQGFNPRPSVSIALPLSVGTQSQCELLDFDLDGQSFDLQIIKERLNETLVSGIRVLDVYETGRKIRDLAYLDCCITLQYACAIGDDCLNKIEQLFVRPTLIVPKKTKSGMQDQDIIPMIRSLQLSQTGDRSIQLHARICCQNPTLNPSQLLSAIDIYLPKYLPSAYDVCRVEVLDHQEQIFR